MDKGVDESMRQIFWTGGIGDIIALESTFTDEYRRSIVRMYWASRTMRQMSPLFTRMPSFPNLKDHVSLWDAWETPEGEPLIYRDFEHAFESTLKPHLVVGPIEDWSIIKRFPEPQPFNYSSFVKYRLAGVDKFKLPNEYAVVCPYSAVNKKATREWRRFHDNDWKWLLNHLNQTNMKGVVLNTGDDPVPQDERLIDLSNRTTLGEAIEVTKKASSYIGIDTGFSVVAAQVMPADRITISTTNGILWNFKHIYYAPKRQFDFIVPHLGATEEEILKWREKSEAMGQLILAKA